MGSLINNHAIVIFETYPCIDKIDKDNPLSRDPFPINNNSLNVNK
jgi:hypothetical protein